MAEMQGLMERLEQAVGRLESLSAGLHRPPGDCGEINGVSGGVAPSVEAFDKLMNSMVAEFLKKSRILAGDVETHAEMVHSAFQAQRAFLLMASQYQQPQEGPVASTASALSVLSVGPGLPPPPPPPGPPPPFDSEGRREESSPSRSALFAQLNQGEAITRGLRHVTDDQKTYKNPSLRAHGGQTPSPTKSHTPGPKSPQSHPPKKHAPVLELEGKKWRVEYQEDRNDLVISETELRQVAYIFKCSKSTLQIKGKINSITIDSCKKLGLVLDNVVGIVEVINSKDIQMQVMGKVPTISINKTEGCHIYLSEDALDCEIVSAKSSEMNILIPRDGDYREFPVPEQFKTAWDGSKLVTEPAEIMVSERPPNPLT
ncbi:adenylyl cyclase-associated protein 2 isoform X4 [Neophocaena asiaeorientalis asiaeorientalis]|uniref:Adenylyl cyclase-associated protein n=1 Tax=Neophocaena asiaeorientalis asiaeorientalis TaxID=1706337 RepID=A0A341CZ63_NEOAA|nr:adenylyl cyclase-associated protein 2 isoform X4 [Neophocaena asiaeorientalis asiaeorientalis]